MWAAFRFLRGYEKVVFRSPRAPQLLNFTHQKGIPVWDIQGKEGEVRFCISRYHYRMLSPYFAKRAADETVQVYAGGLLYEWNRLGPRWGLAVGLGIFFLSLLFFTRFLWSVEITGNATIPEWVIREKLAAQGLVPGVLLSEVDTAQVALRFQVDNPEFSYAAIRFVGTAALVEVREKETVPPLLSENDPCNLVAKVAGKIVRFEVLEGQATVQREESVAEGALLISGVVEHRHGNFSAVHARGRVFAETERVFEYTVPHEIRTVVYTGRERCVSALVLPRVTLGPFCDKQSPFSRYETVLSREVPTVFGRRLPLYVERVKYLETEEKIDLVTVDRARVLAYDKYEEYKRDHLSSEHTVLDETIEFFETEKGLTMRVRLTVLEDIAVEKPFSITLLPENKEKP